jgi:hypothetical protein
MGAGSKGFSDDTLRPQAVKVAMPVVGLVGSYNASVNTLIPSADNEAAAVSSTAVFRIIMVTL